MFCHLLAYNFNLLCEGSGICIPLRNEVEEDQALYQPTALLQHHCLCCLQHRGDANVSCHPLSKESDLEHKMCPSSIAPACCSCIAVGMIKEPGYAWNQRHWRWHQEHYNQLSDVPLGSNSFEEDFKGPR